MKTHCEIEKILEAINNADINLALKLITKLPDVNVLTPMGYSLLLISVLINNYELASTLLDAGANPNIIYNPEGIEVLSVNDVPNEVNHILITDDLIHEITDLGNRIPLHAAINKRHDEISILLIKNGADINLKDSGGCTPLHWAAITGNLNIAKYLCKNAVKVNEQDLALSTPLHEAARKKKINMLSLLLSYGADVMLPDITGQTPLDLTRDNEHLYNLLLKHINKNPDNITHH